MRGDRAEIAPAEFADRSELAHLSEAAVRDRAQRAAHDVARLDGLPIEELRRRQSELSGPATRERANHQPRAPRKTRRADRGGGNQARRPRRPWQARRERP